MPDAPARTIPETLTRLRALVDDLGEQVRAALPAPSSLDDVLLAYADADAAWLAFAHEHHPISQAEPGVRAAGQALYVHRDEMHRALIKAADAIRASRAARAA